MDSRQQLFWTLKCTQIRGKREYRQETWRRVYWTKKPTNLKWSYTFGSSDTGQSQTQPSEKAEAWRVTRWGTERPSEIQGFWGKCKRDNGLGESWRINSKNGVSAPCRPWTEVHKQEEETDKLGRAIPVVDCWLAAWGQNLMFEHQMSHVEELVVLKFPVWNSPCGLCARMSQHEPKTYSNIVMSPSSYVALTTSRAPTNYAACWVLGTTRQHWKKIFIYGIK